MVEAKLQIRRKKYLDFSHILRNDDSADEMVTVNPFTFAPKGAEWTDRIIKCLRAAT